MLVFMKQVFKNKKTDYMTLLFILFLLASFEFAFSAMYNSFTSFNLDIMSLAVLNSIPSLAIVVAIVLNTFIIKYFIANKKQEFSILLLLGRKPKDLFYYLLIQFGLLSLIAFILGIGGGALIMFFINAILKLNLISFSLSYNFISTVLIYCCFLLITIVLILAIGTKQFVSLDTSLAKYLSQKSVSKPAYHINFSSTTKKKKIPIFSILITAIILYLTFTGFRNLMSPNLSYQELLTSFMWVLSGEIIIINLTIPMLYDFLHDSFLLKHPILINAFSAFNNFSQSMLTFINLNAIIIPLILFILFFSSSSLILQSVMISCFLMIVIMISLCLLLRFSIYQQTQFSCIATLYAIGYSPHKLNCISILKNSLFACFGFLIPLLFLGQLFYKAYCEGYLDKSVMFMLILFYLLLSLGCFIYMVIKEKRNQKEVISNVKYLNRG